VVGDGLVGPWRGTFPWQLEPTRINVPPRAREAILQIGLLGALGELTLDALTLSAVK